MGKDDGSSFWQDVDVLDEELDFWHGLDEPKYRRRRANQGVPPGVIYTTPSTLTGNDAMPVGTVIGTVGISGGFGTYTYTLNDPSGRFTIVGNQIQTTSPLTSGFYNVTINATNGLGDNPSFPTTIYVTHVTTYVPTYHLYGF